MVNVVGRKIIISGFVGLDDDSNVVVSDNKEKFLYEAPLADVIYVNIENNNELPLSIDGEPDDEMGGLSYYVPNCNISFYISEEKLSLDEVSERYTMQLLGGLDVFGENYGYSAWTITGYDVDRFMIGNHDLAQILSSYQGKYINFVMEY